MFQPHIKKTITRQTFFSFIKTATLQRRGGDEEGVHWVAAVDDAAQGD